MIFCNEHISKAEGLILAHTIKAGRLSLKKGRVLSQDDIRLLKENNVLEITGARLESTDIPENEAALKLASKLAGKGITLGKAHTGRCNLFSSDRGLIIIEAQKIDELNMINEGVTIGTLMPYSQVEPGQMVATVKIIPFAISQKIIDRCLKNNFDSSEIISLAQFQHRKVGFIQSRLPGTKETVLDSTTDSLLTRLSNMESKLASEIRCNHTSNEIRDSIKKLESLHCSIILIAGASATVDRKDIVPSGIVAAGGTIDHFGMPVDPGNLLLMAHLEDIDVIGLPGCARSIKLNGFDWVLRRRFAGIPVTKRDLMKMGTGGLLTEIPTRPLPRAIASPKQANTPKGYRHKKNKKNISAIILAGGQSRRMNGINKLLCKINNLEIIAHVADTVIKSGANPIIVVTGYQHKEISHVLRSRNIQLIYNPDYGMGMSTSIKVGIGALPSDTDASLICLGDMPMVNTKILTQLTQGFRLQDSHSICIPTYKGKRGNPVLWGANHFPEILKLTGDIGAKHLISDNRDSVYEIQTDEPSITLDIDTQETLKYVTSNQDK